MLITKIDPFTNKENTFDFPITEDQYLSWKDGALVQDVFPHLSADEREFLMTGIVSSSWKKIFGEGGRLEAALKELKPNDECQDSEDYLENGFLPPGMNELEFQNQVIETALPEKPWSPPSIKVYSTKNFAAHKISDFD